jgi:hypothetical protein
MNIINPVVTLSLITLLFSTCSTHQKCFTFTQKLYYPIFLSLDRSDTNPAMPRTIDTAPKKLTTKLPMYPGSWKPHLMQKVPPGVISNPPIITNQAQAR